MNDNKGGSGGFLLGLIIGGGAVFLLGTDKGRKILKSLTEEGFGELSEIIERAGEGIEEEEEVTIPKRKAKVVEEESEALVNSGVKSNGHAATPVAKRRFFRRSKS